MTALEQTFNAPDIKAPPITSTNAEKLMVSYPCCLLKTGKHGKRPDGEKWQENPRAFADWKQGRGIGVITGKTGAVDVDALDVTLAEHMRGYLLRLAKKKTGTPLFRIGLPPKFLMPFTIAEPQKKIVSATFYLPMENGKPDLKCKNQVEILGTGQQFVAYQIHPDTGQPYHWEGGELYDTQAAELVELTADDLQAIIAEFERTAQQMGMVKDEAEVKAAKAPARKRTPQKISAGIQPSDHFYSNYDLRTELEADGAKFVTEDRFYPAGRKHDGEPGGVLLDDGLHFYVHHASDRYADGHRHDVIDLLCDRYSIDWCQPGALVELCRRYEVEPGVSLELHNQRVYKAQQDPQNTSNAFQEDTPDNSEEPTERPMFSPIGGLVANLRPPSWQIRNVFEQDCLAVLYGEPGHGKSFIAMDMAASIATGTDWHGKKTTQGGVFYIAGEGQNGIARRFKAWSIAHNVDLADAPLAVSSNPIAIDDEESAYRVKQAIEAMAKEMPFPPALIVVDTLARNFSGDENSTKDMNTFVRALDYIRRSKGWQASILVVHHTGKDTSKGARGSSVLKAAIDTEYSASMDENKVIALHNHKMKEGELAKLMAFKLEGVKLPIVDEDLNDIWSCAPSLVDGEYKPPKAGSQGKGKNQTLALQSLNELYKEHRARLEADGRSGDTATVTIEDWRNACIRDGMESKRFNEVKRSLAEQGRVTLAEPYALLP